MLSATSRSAYVHVCTRVHVCAHMHVRVRMQVRCEAPASPAVGPVPFRLLLAGAVVDSAVAYTYFSPTRLLSVRPPLAPRGRRHGRAHACTHTPQHAHTHTRAHMHACIQVRPPLGPVGGGTEVVLTVAHADLALPLTELSCRFGDALVAALTTDY